MEDRVADEGVLLSIATCRSAVWAWSITSKFVAAVCNSNSKLDTREVKKLNGISAKMAMPRPHAVAMSASAIPPVTACTANSSFPRKLNERISPVIVPNRPSNGARVTRVSITTRKPRSLGGVTVFDGGKHFLDPFRIPAEPTATPPNASLKHDGERYN